MADAKPDRCAPRSAGQFAARTVAELLDTVNQRSAECLDRPGVEPVHDLRVSLRRLRAVLSFFDPLLGEKVALARAEIREQALDLGQLRDIDVFLEHLRDGLAPVRDDEADTLREVLERRRDALSEEIGEQLATRAWRRPLDLVRTSARYHPGRGRSDAAATSFASRRLDRWCDRWLVSSSEMTKLNPHDLHRVRIRAKKLRYACEVSADLYPAQAQSATATVEAFKEFQDLLGAANDAATARRIVQDAGCDLVGSRVPKVDLGRAGALRQEIIDTGRFWAARR
ncbi:CHAD domain-containing protein [Propionibacterium cyclohexanicum]|nr:CHAD domain-containing protein [Propionibacterium cyclohexanicum]